MQVAINNLKNIAKLKEYEVIYVFDREPLKELLEINLHCIHKDFIDYVDINLTDYNIDCIKKCTIDNNISLPPKKDYKYAIIVPNYNNDHGKYKGKTFLRNCIESILNQTYKNFELIVIDDMSTDTSVKTIEEYKSKEKYIDKIHLIKNIRKRYNGGSRNVGIEYALKNLDFDYFVFVDSDDWWKDESVLESINNKMFDNELMTIGCEGIGVRYKNYNKAQQYEDLYALNGNVWCTAWSKIIRKDKIVYFCEDTLMEDRVWTYRLADNINFDKVTNVKKICYCWNRLNNTNSVSVVKNNYWDASAWCHIGHQKQLISQMKHKEMIPLIEQRINGCIDKVNRGVYEQF